MKTLFVLLAISIGFYSCTKDDTEVVFQLPQKTQSGAHTFGFMLGTSVWTNHNKVCFLFAGGCRENLRAIYHSDGDITVGADRVLYKSGSRNSTETFSLTLRTNFAGVGDYSTMANDTISMYYSFSDKSDYKVYVSSEVNPNVTVRLTKIDTVNKILSGEFYGTVFSKAQDTTNAISLTDSLIIQDGRFDIKM